MVQPLQEPPDWAHDRHIGKGGTHLCHHCFSDDESCYELEVVKTKRLATWMGVNWEDGFEEKVECPNCGRSGQIKTKLMDSYRNRIRFNRLGAAAPIQEAPDEHPKRKA